MSISAVIKESVMSDTATNGTATRRQMIGTVGAATVGAMMLREGVCCADNPAAQVEDKGASIRITTLKAYRVGGKVYIKIETMHLGKILDSV